MFDVSLVFKMISFVQLSVQQQDVVLQERSVSVLM